MWYKLQRGWGGGRGGEVGGGDFVHTIEVCLLHILHFLIEVSGDLKPS